MLYNLTARCLGRRFLMIFGYFWVTRGFASSRWISCSTAMLASESDQTPPARGKESILLTPGSHRAHTASPCPCNALIHHDPENILGKLAGFLSRGVAVLYIYVTLCNYTSSTAQGGGGSFKDRKLLQDVVWCSEVQCNCSCSGSCSCSVVVVTAVAAVVVVVEV